MFNRSNKEMLLKTSTLLCYATPVEISKSNFDAVGWAAGRASGL